MDGAVHKVCHAEFKSLVSRPMARKYMLNLSSHDPEVHVMHSYSTLYRQKSATWKKNKYY